MPMAPVVAVVDPHHAAMAAIQAQINALMAERAQGGRVRAEDSDEELEPFFPVSQALRFHQGSKYPISPPMMVLLIPRATSVL